MLAMYSPALLPSRLPRRGGEEADLVDHRRQLLGCREGDGLAGVLDLDGDQLVGTGLDGIGDAEQGE